jgi:uncharacterized cupin superfamily protein
VRVVNVSSCDLGGGWERGEFRCCWFELREPLGASVIGATVYEMRRGEKLGPYHYHHGFEEWMYVVSGSPVLRDPEGERTLAPGALVAFGSGPQGAHTMHGPGRVVMFSTGANGWGEAFVSVYPDSEKIAAAPGVMFRRGDALDAWDEGRRETPQPPSGQCSPMVEVTSVRVEGSPGAELPGPSRSRGMPLGPLLGAQTWAATLCHLAPGEATSPYHYEWCREEWALVLSGAPTLRHPDGEDVLQPGDTVCFPQGPTGAHQLRNDGGASARVVIFSTPAGRPMSAFYPDDGTVLIRIPGHEGLVFREADQIEDYWDGEPGAGAP